MGGYTAHRVSDSRKPAPDQALAVLATLSDVPTEVLQSRTQARAVGRVRAAAAHVLRVDCNLKVKEVAPLLGRTEQTVCDFSRNARLGLQQGDDVGALIERARQVLYDRPPTV